MRVEASGSPEVAVIILTMNQRDLTLQCLSSLRSVTSPPIAVVVWDNGSHDGTAEAVRAAFPEVVVHHEPENLGVAAGRNAAAALAMNRFHPPFLLFLDNDTVVTPDFLPPLLRPFQNNATLGQTIPKVKLLEDPERIDEAGTSLRIWLAQSTGIGYGEIDRGQYETPRESIAGGCSLVRADAFRTVGGFDTLFDPYGPEDIDFSLRVKKAGYYNLYVPNSLIFHKRSKIPWGGKYTETYTRTKAKNWISFIRRHGTLRQQFAFWTVGLPFIVCRAIIREGRRGNLRAVRGAAEGALDLWRSPHNASRKRE